MRNFIASLVMFVSVISNAYAAGNQVYIDQIGNNSNLNVVQTGDGNNAGSATANTISHGDSQTINIQQIGVNNNTNFNIVGTGTSASSTVTGNLNTTVITCGSDSGTCDNATLHANATGDNNNMSITSVINSTSTIDITGGGNHATINNTSTNMLGASAAITVQGDSNTVGVTQDGVAGTNGHSATVSVIGTQNNVSVMQGGMSDSTVSVSTNGIGNNISVKSNHQ